MLAGKAYPLILEKAIMIKPAMRNLTPAKNIGGIPSDHIAFGLGDKGFVAINGTGSDAAGVTYTTALPDGAYCNVVHYDFSTTGGRCVDPATGQDAPPGSLITVSGGQIVATLPAMDAFAIHVAARD